MQIKRFKKSSLILLAGLMLSLLSITSAVALPSSGDNKDGELLLKQSMNQRYAVHLAVSFLTNWHYKDVQLDDELSSQILDQYIETLDPNRAYFLSADIAGMEKWRLQLDDVLRHDDLDAAFDIFNLYVLRVKNRIQFARKQLKTPMDFSIDEEFQFDRTESPWIADSKTWDEQWRKRVKNDWLRLKLTDKDEEEIRKTLDDRYTNLDRRISELNEEDVFQYFMNAVSLAVEPHTAYMSSRSSENFDISMKLSLEGIGALLQRENEYTSIARVIPGGPAKKDGRLKAEDRITGVAQGREGKMVDVIGWRLDDVVDLIRGPKGTYVRLEVLPANSGEGGASKVIEILRNEVKLEEQAAKSRIIEITQGEGITKVGVIDLPVFYLDFRGRAEGKKDYRSSTRDVQKLIDEMKAEGIESLVIDLRSNGGGSLLEATTLTGLFIDQGPVVQVRDSRGRISLERDDDPGVAWDGPMAVLVNRYSASASEIFAAAIQDYQRGLVVGEPTYGKGTVQNLVNLDDYSPGDKKRLGQLKLTVAQFFRINGGSTQNRGVTPDISFPTPGDAADFGESALTNALPWTQIEKADYKPVNRVAPVLAVLDSRYRERLSSSEEFSWIYEDIEEYKENKNRKTVSLLEDGRRTERKENEAKRKQRKEQRYLLHGLPIPVDEEESESEELAEAKIESSAADTAERNPELKAITATGEGADTDTDSDAVIDEDETDEEELPDLILEETARILADATRLMANKPMFAQDLSKLKTAKEAVELIN
ncbi:MAG: carboxy terminal-processing peptidase [Xanthomonadales bacterium]|nr:carboxy terminal-processing peptidase [Xanthomonadales bacterium]